MEEYKKIVSDYFKTKSSELIYNSSKEHAKYLTNTLISHAKESINLYTSGDDLPFYKTPEVLASIKKKIAKGIKVRIILDKDCKKKEYSNIFPGAEINCIKKNTGNFEIFLSNLIPDYKFMRVKHFMAVDNSAYRVEKAHTPGADIVEALACANAPELASEINRIFDQLIDEYCLPVKH